MFYNDSNTQLEFVKRDEVSSNKADEQEIWDLLPKKKVIPKPEVADLFFREQLITNSSFKIGSNGILEHNLYGDISPLTFVIEPNSWILVKNYPCYYLGLTVCYENEKTKKFVATGHLMRERYAALLVPDIKFKKGIYGACNQLYCSPMPDMIDKSMYEKMVKFVESVKIDANTFVSNFGKKAIS